MGLAAEAEGLVKDFDGKRAVDGVSLSVPTGSISGILGPNGAGKTTTIRMMLGIIEPSAGSRRLLGHDRPLEVAREVGYLPEERGLYPGMQVGEAIADFGMIQHKLAEMAMEGLYTASGDFAYQVGGTAPAVGLRTSASRRSTDSASGSVGGNDQTSARLTMLPRWRGAPGPPARSPRRRL